MLVQKSHATSNVCFWWLHCSTGPVVDPRKAEPPSQADKGFAPPISSYPTSNVRLSVAVSLFFSRLSSTFILDAQRLSAVDAGILRHVHE